MRSLTLNYFEDLPANIEEAMNRLRVNIGLCGSQYKKIMITSSIPDEGKSLVSAHLWKMVAESGKKVVLVDCDIRKSNMRSKYKLSVNDDGTFLALPHFLAGRAAYEDIVYETNIPHAFIVPAINVTNAPILLQNRKFLELLDRLASEFDLVLVDTPPIVNVADGGVIASCCDGAVIVVRNGLTPRKLVAKTINEINRANCPLLGVVLNRVETKLTPYYAYRYRYYRSYKYYYGDYGEYGVYGSSKKNQKSSK